MQFRKTKGRSLLEKIDASSSMKLVLIQVSTNNSCNKHEDEISIFLSVV
jgi:hypothetical protein